MKKQEMHTHLQEHIQNMNIEDFLVEDTDHFLNTLNYYKMKNIYYNKEKFLKYLEELQYSYYDHLYDIPKDTNKTTKDIVSSVEKKSDTPTLGSSCMNVNLDKHTENKKIQAISAVRGYFLFTAMEFALGTSLRLKLRERLQKEQHKHTKH